MQVRVEDQVEDARVVDDGHGPVLILKTGLVSPRAFAALVVAFADLAAHSSQYLKDAG